MNVVYLDFLRTMSTMDINFFSFVIDLRWDRKNYVIVFPFPYRREGWMSVAHHHHVFPGGVYPDVSASWSFIVIWNAKVDWSTIMNPLYAGLLAAEGMQYLFVESFKVISVVALYQTRFRADSPYFRK